MIDAELRTYGSIDQLNTTHRNDFESQIIGINIIQL